MSDFHAVIIDDDETSIDVLATLLETMNASYHAIQDPSQLQNLSDILPNSDIIFLDVDMPINGYNILRTLQDTYQIQAPVVAYTVYTEEAESLHTAGFHGLLSKPLKVEQFEGWVQQILAGELVWDLG